jgi:hypothetical protein
MTLPLSGLIGLNQVNVELGRSSTQLIGLNESTVRTLAVKPSGLISLSDLYGKTYTTAISGQYNSFYASTSSSTSFTFNSVAFGVAATGRRIVIGVSWNIGGTNVWLSSATIAGVSATITQNTSSLTGWERSAIIRATIPSGTSGTVVLNFNGTITLGCVISSFSLYGGTNTFVSTQYYTVQPSTSYSTTNTTQSGDYVISILGRGGSAGTTWNRTELFDYTLPTTHPSYESVFSYHSASSFYATTTSTNVTATTATSYGILTTVAFR